MKRLTILALVIVLTPVASHGTTDDASQSAAPAAALTASPGLARRLRRLAHRVA